MDKFTSIAKGGWHPSGDKAIHRDTWRSDLKGIAGRKKDNSLEDARNHTSAPLSSLKDPDSFGPPPKHYPNGMPPPSPVASSSSSALSKPQAYRAPSPPRGGLGSVVPTPSSRKAEAEEESKPKPPPVPYRVDTSGLRTDHLPAPPRRSHGESSPVSATPPRAPVASKKPPVAPPRTQAGPPPVLPPRQNEYPDEHTPAPPPPYQEAAKQANPASGLINGQAISRLGQAGVSVPGFNIGSRQQQSASPANSAQGARSNPASGLINGQSISRLGQAGVSVPGFNIGSQQQQSAGPANPDQGAQVSELQQRFSRLKTVADANPAIVNAAGSSLAAAAASKKPPPPPPKKSGLANIPPQSTAASGSGPPPLPMSSKPRPT